MDQIAKRKKKKSGFFMPLFVMVHEYVSIAGG